MMLKRYLLHFALLLVVGGLQAQTAYKGQLRVSDEHFSVQGQLLRVQMRISYDRNVLNSGEMLNLTPVLKTATRRQALSSVVISGHERRKYEQRRLRNQYRQRLNIPVVKKDGHSGERYFDYDTTIPFEQWMTNASLYFESEESSWTGRSSMYEDQLISQISIDSAMAAPCQVAPSRHEGAVSSADAPADSQLVGCRSGSSTIHTAPISWVPKLSLNSTTTVSEQKVSGTISLCDSRHIGDMNDRDFCKAVATAIKERLSGENAIVAQLDLHGYGTPTGNYRRNEQQSAERAQQLKAYLIEHQTAKAVNLTWTAEDWQRITELTQSDNTLPLRAAALDIMQHVDITQGREQQLRMLAGGQTYALLEKSIFPQVVRIDYTAILQHTQVNSGDLTQLVKFYEIAAGLPRGSNEYNDLIDLAARLHPDHAVAAINAAGVALTKGDIGRAEQYLRPWQTDARAYQNLGVLYLLKGDFARAEVYLKMAEAQGVKEAADVLRTLKR